MPRRRGEAEGHDLDRQRKGAEARNELARIGDDDHPSRRRRHDLLAQQRAAAALDQSQLGVDFVRAVHSQVEFRQFVERRYGDAETFCLRFRPLRGCDAADLKSGCDLFAHAIDEMLGGRSGAQPKPHARLDQFGRAPRRLDLHPVLRCVRRHGLSVRPLRRSGLFVGAGDP